MVMNSILIAVAAVACFNVCMTSLKKTLDRVAPTSKADSIVGVLAKFSKIAVEFLSSNSTVLPKPAQEALADQKAE